MAVQWLESAADSSREVGWKAAALAQATEHGVQIPRGFVVTAPTFESFVRTNGLEQKIQQALQRADRDDPDSLQQAANRIRSLIRDHSLSAETRDEIVEAYGRINMSEEVRSAGEEAVDLVGGQRETEFVAVRSSATGSHIPGAHHVALNVNGKDSVVEAVKQCWASLYSAEALSVDEELGELHSLAVIVQRMVDADVSGSVFNRHPLGGSQYVLEALWGLGTALSSGNATPDLYEVDESAATHRQEIANKGWKVVRDPTSGKTIKQRVAGQDREATCLDRDRIRDVLELVKQVENHRRDPFKLDFCITNGSVSLVGIEPVHINDGEPGQESYEPIIRGRGASPGTGTGSVNIIYSDSDVTPVLDGEIVTAVDAAERFVPILPQVNGFVADAGGLSSNLALIARQLSVACIVGAGNATDMLTKGESVIVDGMSGLVAAEESAATSTAEVDANTVTPMAGSLTATSVKVLDDAVTGEAEGVVLDTPTDTATAAQLSQEYGPDQVWVRPHNGGSLESGALVNGEADIAGNGTILSTYGGVMRSPNLVEAGAAFIGLDVASLKRDGGMDALLNAVEQVGEVGERCETALLLQDMDQRLIQKAVESGIDTVAVPASRLPEAKQAVAKAEKRFMLDRLRRL